MAEKFLMFLLTIVKESKVYQNIHLTIDLIGILDLITVWIMILKGEKNEYRTNMVDNWFHWPDGLCLTVFDTMDCK